MSDLDNFDGYVDFSKKGTLPECPGIYFVAEDGRVVYIGQSINVKRRFIQHHRAMDFAELDDPKVYWKSCEVEELQKTEQDYIDKFNPRLNINRVIGRTPRLGLFRARAGDLLIFGPKTIAADSRQPELVRVLDVGKTGIKVQTGDDIITLRFVYPNEIEPRGKGQE